MIYQNNVIQSNSQNTNSICEVIQGVDTIREKYLDYLKDESRLTGNVPERIYFPTSTDEVSQAIIDIKRRGETVTISGARTGIVGGAVSKNCKNILSLEKLVFTPQVFFNKQTNSWAVKVGAGTRLNELHKILQKKKYTTNHPKPPHLMFPVDPTEQTASIGGNVSTNASGARSFYYGPTRNWVQGLVVILNDGSILRLSRNEIIAKNNIFLLKLSKKESFQEIYLPDLNIPDTKHVAGYNLKPNMDAIDLFIGSEGTLGIVSEVELKLCIPPKNMLYLVIFLPKCNYINIINDLKEADTIKIVAIEFMDSRSVNLLKKYRDNGGMTSEIPVIPKETEHILYIEIILDDKIKEDTLHELDVILENNNAGQSKTWAGFSKIDLNKMKKFRHALPSIINDIITERKKKIPSLTKIGTDMAVPKKQLDKIINLYESTLKSLSLEYYIFGHIGDSHLHVNIIPNSIEQMHQAHQAYIQFAQKIVEYKGSVAAEHGIGRIKKQFLNIQFTKTEVKNMLILKKNFDPDSILNPSVLFT